MEYQGWTLFDKVLIVAKPCGQWDFDQNKYVTNGIWQGYVVDPSNNKMKENAQRWAETCTTKYDENGKYCGYDRTPGTEYLYDNDGFALELLESASGSSQGGKLSFWNCMITAPDGLKFKIGIAADLLLELLMQSTFENGKCSLPLCFARCKGGVGMLNKNIESYQQALADMQKKKEVKTKKTSKHTIGHVYSSLTQTDIYAADLYSWYEPIEEKYQPWNNGSVYTRVIGYKRREKPVRLFWFPQADGYKTDGVCKLSKLAFGTYTMQAKNLPARIDEGMHLEYDTTLEAKLDEYNASLLKPHYGRDKLVFYGEYEIGLGLSPDTYTLPESLRKALKDNGYSVVD